MRSDHAFARWLQRTGQKDLLAELQTLPYVDMFGVVERVEWFGARLEASPDTAPTFSGFPFLKAFIRVQVVSEFGDGTPFYIEVFVRHDNRADNPSIVWWAHFEADNAAAQFGEFAWMGDLYGDFKEYIDPSVRSYLLYLCQTPEHFIETRRINLTRAERRRGEQSPPDREDLPTIVLWSPEEVIEQKYEPGGGAHASPIPHHRRGHLRRLPDGRITYVRPCWIGPPQFEKQGTQYKVIQPIHQTQLDRR